MNKIIPMITQIPTPQRSHNKVQGEFYPLQKQELIALKKAKLINNTAFQAIYHFLP